MKKLCALLLLEIVCGCNQQPANEVAPAPIAPAVTVPDSIQPNILLIEQAVDAWLFFHLPDFKNYEPIIRSTDHSEGSHIYIHHLRYRYMNQTGGFITVQQSFKVDTSTPGENSIPYSVTPIE